jgi:hypothetical protein
MEADNLETLLSKWGRCKAGKESVKKRKKRDSWIWLESLMQEQGQSDEKLAAYKKESKCPACLLGVGCMLI